MKNKLFAHKHKGRKTDYRDGVVVGYCNTNPDGIIIGFNDDFGWTGDYLTSHDKIVTDITPYESFYYIDKDDLKML